MIENIKCCSGGEMLEYTSKTFSDGLSTDDVSRIAYQLLGAVDHCAKHNVIHRGNACECERPWSFFA